MLPEGHAIGYTCGWAGVDVDLKKNIEHESCGFKLYSGSSPQ